VKFKAMDNARYNQFKSPEKFCLQSAVCFALMSAVESAVCFALMSAVESAASTAA